MAALSVVDAKVGDVISSSDLIAQYVPMRLPDPVSVGFRDLDDLTGGFRPGQVWVVTSTPGQGRTTLVVQWAAALAVDHGWPTWLVTAREDGQTVASRLMALTAKVPLQQLLWHSPEIDGIPRLGDARRRLSSARLHVAPSPTAASPEVGSPYRSREVAWGERAAVVVDDADLTNWCSPDWATQLAGDGALLIVSVPRHLVAQQTEEDPDLLPQWARVADVILEVRHRGPIPGERAEGEALLTVLKHRHGPTTVARVAFQGHYARFVDLKD